MVKLAIAGLAGAFVGGLSTWVLLPEPTPALEREDRAQEDGTDEPSSPVVPAARARRRGQGPETLPECERALEARESQLEKVRATAARALAQRAVDAPRPLPDGDELPGPPARGAEPGAGQTGAAPPAASPEEQAAADRAAADRVDEALLEELHVTDEERRITREVMCPRQDNQRALVLDFADGRVDTEALLRSFAQERSTANEAMRRSLGAARFRELRGVGGMGILVRRLCSRP